MLAIGVFFFGCEEPTSEKIAEIYQLQMDPTPKNLATLHELLDAKDRDLRVTALSAIVTLGVDDAAGLTVAALNDEDAFVRATAAKLIGDQDDPALSGFLARVLREDPDALVRRRACQALARIGGDEAAPALITALRDPDSLVRLEAIKGARRVAPGQGSARLAELLADDPMWEVRVRAASALGLCGDPAAAEALQVALSDPIEFVRAAAAKALADFRPEPSPKRIAGDPEETD
ncbi:MAG: HEAT repeat domain-containing protein [Acidobacteriota bacterium]